MKTMSRSVGSGHPIGDGSWPRHVCPRPTTSPRRNWVSRASPAETKGRRNGAGAGDETRSVAMKMRAVRRAQLSTVPLKSTDGEALEGGRHRIVQRGWWHRGSIRGEEPKEEEQRLKIVREKAEGERKARE